MIQLSKKKIFNPPEFELGEQWVECGKTIVIAIANLLFESLTMFSRNAATLVGCTTTVNRDLSIPD